METFLFLAALLVILGIFAVPLSQRLGTPILLLILLVGMLVGEDGPGKIPFDDFSLAFNIGSLALAIILFAGGMETNVDATKHARLPAITLATIGVIITAIVVGSVVYATNFLPLEMALLLGAIVASTDAAATFMLIQQSGVAISPRLRNTLVLESGLNDPMAIFLTLMMTGLVDAKIAFSSAALGEAIPLLASQLGLGIACGFAGGWVASLAITRITLPVGLYPALALSFGLLTFSGTALIGGSGFLAIYLCGIMIAREVKTDSSRILHFSEALQWLSQIILFLMLGLLVTPSKLVGTLEQAIIVAATLIFLARPLAVFICTLPFRFRVNEIAFMSWVGLRGAVPIFLAILPIISPGPVTIEFFNIVFVVVVASLVLQGSTIGLLARGLRLENHAVDRSQINQ